LCLVVREVGAERNKSRVVLNPCPLDQILRNRYATAIFGSAMAWNVDDHHPVEPVDITKTPRSVVATPLGGLLNNGVKLFAGESKVDFADSYCSEVLDDHQDDLFWKIEDRGRHAGEL